MSFITLKSQGNESGRTQNTSDGASNFINNFNDPLIISPGDTLELVSCSINRPDTFVITTLNNELVFRRGYGLGNVADIEKLDTSLRFAQHLVKVPPGTYTGQQLAGEITTQFNENTLLQQYADSWEIVYTPAIPPAIAKFTVNCKQIPTSVTITTEPLTYNPSRREDIYNELAPVKVTDPLTDITELQNTRFTDPFMPTTKRRGRDITKNSKLNLQVGLEQSGFIHPTAGEDEIRVLPVSVVRTILIDGPVGRPAGRVVTFDLPNLGTITSLSGANINFLDTGAPGDYTNGEDVFLEFATPDFQRPQYAVGTNLYGLNYVTATATVNGAGELTGLTRTGNPQAGYQASDIFAVTKAGGTFATALVQVNGPGAIGEINGTLYNDATLQKIKAITQIPGGEDPTAFGAEVFINSSGFGTLTDAEITPAESDVMSTTNGVFTVGDLFFVTDGDDNGVIRVATVTPARAPGDQFYFENYRGNRGYSTTGSPVEGDYGNGWDWQIEIEGLVWYFHIHEDGALVMTQNTANSTSKGTGNLWFKAVADPVELALGKPFNTMCSWETAFPDGRVRPENRPKIFLTQDGGLTTSSVPLIFLTTYPQIQLAYSKSQTQNNLTETDNPEEIYSSSYSDLSITLRADLDENIILLDGVQQKGAPNDISFPQADWSDTNILYDNFEVARGGVGGFVFGTSGLVISLGMINNFNPVMYVGFTVDGVITGQQVIFLDDPDALPTPKIPADYTSNLREHYYPLKSVAFYGEAYPFNIDELNLTNPGGQFGQSRLSFKTTGYSEETSVWRERNRKNVLWVTPALDNNPGRNWNDDVLQSIQAGFNEGNQPIVVKFDEINSPDIMLPDDAAFPPDLASGKISYFDASPGGASAYSTLWYSPFYPNINNGIATSIGMPAFFQNPVPTPATGFNGTEALLSNPRQTIQVEIPEFNTKSWSGGSNDVGRAVGVIPAEQWENNDTLANDTLYYKSDYTKPIELNSQVTQPIYSVTCRLRDTEGKLIKDLQNPTTVTFILKEGDEVKQQRIMDKAMARASATRANLQENKISTANENMPRF